MSRGPKNWPLWAFFLMTSAVFGLVTESLDALGEDRFSILHAAIRGAIFGVMVTTIEAYRRRRHQQDETGA